MRCVCVSFCLKPRLTRGPLTLQILPYLHPLDLLHLAHTCRSLRSVLTSRSSRPIWAAALRSVSNPPPACPDHLNEIQYSRLLFDTHCTVSRCLACACSAEAELFSSSAMERQCKQSHGVYGAAHARVVCPTTPCMPSLGLAPHILLTNGLAALQRGAEWTD
jgi:hypothetical protein